MLAQSGHHETIFAISSGAGRAGVAVLRVSGGQVRAILNALCGRVPGPRVATLLSLCEPGSGDVVDHGLVLFFPAPASFTGEDVCEFHLHGSVAIVRKVLGILGRFPNCRPAQAGDFTRRAVLSGKLDLLDAESLADVLGAETELQRKLAWGGSIRLRNAVSLWRAQLIELLARVEAQIDFSDEGDVQIGDGAVYNQLLSGLCSEFADAARGLQSAERVRSGFRVAVLGPVNAGKSSLVNALADRDITIVSSQPGTTRDVVDVHLDLGGLAVIVTDTAGLRETSDDIEAEGIRRAHGAASNADLVLWVTDDILIAPPAGLPECIRVFSKCDGGMVSALPDEVIPISSKTGFGLAALIESIRRRSESVLGDVVGGVMVLHVRQALALHRGAEALARAAIMPADAEDLLAEEIRCACRALDELIGRIGTEDVLDALFSRFCIGK